jgi:hypothetical protein
VSSGFRGCIGVPQTHLLARGCFQRVGPRLFALLVELLTQFPFGGFESCLLMGEEDRVSS